MRQVNLRLQGLLFSFSFALLSSVCLGYYAMSQSNFRTLQAQEIQAEREKSQKLLREIEVFEALDQIETILEVEISPPVTVQWSCLPLAAQYRTVTPWAEEILTESEPAPSLHFEELAAEQKRLLDARLGVFQKNFDSTLLKYR